VRREDLRRRAEIRVIGLRDAHDAAVPVVGTGDNVLLRIGDGDQAAHCVVSEFRVWALSSVTLKHSSFGA